MTTAIAGKYLVAIGLEVHVQLKTNSKMFCACAVRYGDEPNTLTCPVCLGLPGAMPVLNLGAIKKSAKRTRYIRFRDENDAVEIALEVAKRKRTGADGRQSVGNRVPIINRDRFALSKRDIGGIRPLRLDANTLDVGP